MFDSCHQIGGGDGTDDDRNMTELVNCAEPKGTLFSTVLAIVMTNLDSNKYRSEQSNYA